MPHGATARRTAQKSWSQAKTAAKKAAGRAEGRSAADSDLTVADADAVWKCSQRPHAVPTVTEEDLLAFQHSHFGDDSRPYDFFIDPDTAINAGKEFGEAEEDDDGLGWYPDGTKRTLTEEQVAMFRHSETMALLGEQRRGDTSEQNDYTELDPDAADASDPQGSDVSSIERDLVGLAESLPPKESTQKKVAASPSVRSESTNFSRNVQRRARKNEIPYDQRHKRKWEAYIDEEDPVHGSLTHRRMVRELDEQTSEKVDMDY